MSGAAATSADLDGGVLRLVLVVPQVLLVVEEAVVDDLGQLAGQLGARRVMAGAVAARVLPQVWRRLRDDQDLVDVVVVQLAVRVLVRPIGEGVAPAVHLLHLLVEHKVQLLRLVRLGAVLIRSQQKISKIFTTLVLIRSIQHIKMTD